MSASTALVTIAIGERHATRWRKFCRPNWTRYAERHGFDVHCLEAPLDESDRARARSPAWQKCLVLGQPFAAGYERVVWIDADVVINPDAPSIVEGVAADRVGAVDEFTMMPEVDVDGIPAAPLAVWEHTTRRMTRTLTGPDQYRAWGLPSGYDRLVQTGVMILSPRHHREVLERAYLDYEDVGDGMFEMAALSYELIKSDLVSWLDVRFNTLWMEYRARRAPFLVDDREHPRTADAVARGIDDVYFMHFAVGDDAIEYVRPENPARREVSRRAVGSDRYRCRSPVLITTSAGTEVPPGLMEAVERVRPPDIAAAEGDVAAALDELFEHHEAAIHLDAGCQVDSTFFRFCDELLEHYHDDERVMAISGNNFQFGGPAGDASYYFSRYPHTWGWATWRRAWRINDAEMSDWPRLRDEGWLERLFDDPHAVRYWRYLFEESRGVEGAWDYAWTLTCWRAGGLTVLPNVNLATYVGHRARGRTGQRGLFESVPLESVDFPLRHPEAVARDLEADTFSEDVLFSGRMRRMFERARDRRRVLAKLRE